MVLDSKRNSVNFILDPIAKVFSKLHPNTISWASFVVAFLSGVAIFLSPGDWQILLPVSAVLVLLSGLFDAIDGKVARLTGRTSKRGDLLDHILDRYSDVVMIGAVAFSSWCDPYLGMLALIGVLLTSYMGTQCQAVGGGRLYSGLLGRADRIVLLVLAPLLELALLMFGDGRIVIAGIGLTAFELVMLWFAVVGNITAVQRAVNIWKMLDQA